MFSSKCGRLLIAAGVPAAAVGLTLAAGGAAAAAPVATPVVHAVTITTDAPNVGRPAVVAVQTHLPEQARPGTMPAVDPIRPVAVPQLPGTMHPQPGVQPGTAHAPAADKQDGARTHVFHQIVIIKIETTAFTFTSH